MGVRGASRQLTVRGLAAGWKAARSRTTGSTYYFNKATNEKTFDLPVRALWSSLEGLERRVPTIRQP